MNRDLLIKKSIINSIKTKEEILENEGILRTINQTSKKMIEAFINGRKVLFCGNGGSAADAQHLAAELSGKFYLDREPLFAGVLGTNFSYLTAVSNDYSYNDVFARAVKANGKLGDILVAISTSGNSINVIEALKVARDKEMITVGLSGETGGNMKNLCHYLIKVPSTDTPRIQESHILIGHIICEIVEKEIFGKKSSFIKK